MSEPASKLELRCSGLPLFMRCAGSAIPVKHPIFEPEPEFNNPAKLGSAVHEPLARMVRDSNEEPDLAPIAQGFGVDIDDLAQLYYYGKRCWSLLAEHFGSLPVAEQYFEREFPTFVLSGHPDMLSQAGMKPCAVGDWKSGYVEYDASWQLFGAGPLCGARRGVIVWLRETWAGKAFVVVEFPSPEDIVRQLTAQVEKMHAGECVTGPHCTSMYCPRQHECEAFTSYTQGSVAMLGVLVKDALPVHALVAHTYDAYKAAQKACDVYRLLMNHVLDADGEFSPGEGRKVMRITTHPKAFNAQKALGVMVEFGVAEPAECFKVAVKKMKKAVEDTAKDAGMGKGARYKAFLEVCEDAGALYYARKKTRVEIRI